MGNNIKRKRPSQGLIDMMNGGWEKLEEERNRSFSYEPISDRSDEKLNISVVIPSFRRMYFFDGIFWYKRDDISGKLLQLDNFQIDVMIKNTVEGQWLLDGKFEERTDIRTWVTEENWV
jgi:hypothetical protein